MTASDDDFINDESDEDVVSRRRRQRQANGQTTRSGRSQGATAAGRTRERWEDMQRTWDTVKEGLDGSLAGTVEGMLEADKRRHLLRDTTPLQRGIIRHLTLILDLSSAMAEKDFRPTRYLLIIRLCMQFVTSFFSQNPISQLAIIGSREGLAIRISPMSGNPAEHIAALQKLRNEEPKGNPSLMNSLELARAGLRSSPSHGTREILLIWGALLSADPGDVHKTISKLVDDGIRASVIGLAARLHICSELVARTNGLSDGSSTATAGAKAEAQYYGVAMHEQHFGELLMAHTIPPVTRGSLTSSADPSKGAGASAAPSLLQMGFPSRTTDAAPSLCACHAQESKGGYYCTRCNCKVCGLPMQCPICNLQLVQSTHLARSYHHLFPLRNYVVVSWAEARRKGSTHCFACLLPFPTPPHASQTAANGAHTSHGESSTNKAVQGSAVNGTGKKPASRRQDRSGNGGASESSRYECTTCHEHFCIDCDVLAHEVVHNCAGCLAKSAEELQANGTDDIAS